MFRFSIALIMRSLTAHISSHKTVIEYSLLLLILFSGAYFRFTNINWDENTHLHPDERFLTMVAADISPAKSFSEYFHTDTSPLNPHNHGFNFYVYGTLPLFLVRYLAAWTGYTGYDQIFLLGRVLSALFDLLSVAMVYVIGLRFYNRLIAVLAAFFSACSVLQIQLSHFFVVDTFALFFSLCAVYCAMLPGDPGLKSDETAADGMLLRCSAAALFAGLAAACKLNMAPLLLIVPAALCIRVKKLPAQIHWRTIISMGSVCAAAVLVFFLSFRIFQPYAFSGPSILNMSLNPQWLANIKTQLTLASGAIDFPPALQWARRPLWFPWVNTFVWGMGPALGILAAAGFIWMGVRIIRGEGKQHRLLWGWTAAYFLWQSLTWNCTMRYMLPVYPLFAIMAAWTVNRLWLLNNQTRPACSCIRKFIYRRSKHCAVLICFISLSGTVLWAWSFTRIYTRPVSRVAASRWIYRNIPGPINVRIEAAGEMLNQPMAFPYNEAVTEEKPFSAEFTPRKSGVLRSLYCPHIIDQSAMKGQNRLWFVVEAAGDDQAEQEISGISDAFTNRGAGSATEKEIIFSSGLPVSAHKTYRLTIIVLEGSGQFVFRGSALLCESSWDDCLPLRLDGYDGYGGIYPPNLNLDVYDAESPAKLERIVSLLDRADYMVISSSRQWGSISRLPERYPLTAAFYRNLLGIPGDAAISRGYTVAQPGMFAGRLGFDLVKVFQSNPALGSWQINDQQAEEVFTVYDHPRVFVFKKRSDFSAHNVRAVFQTVNLHEIINLPPGRLPGHPANIMLPEERVFVQRQSGTWSKLFNSASLLNRSKALGAALWYGALLLLGVFMYPLVRYCLPGLHDRGYPLAKIFGLLLLSYLVWVAGSGGIPVTRTSIALAFMVLLLLGAYAAYWQKEALYKELRERAGFFLAVELIGLCSFIIFLIIRQANPDLWHPYRGGEKPMDFAFFTAILKSQEFPPYDPWYAGGYINYYYFGFVLAGTLVKLLGIAPATGYNIVIPGMFSLLISGAFSFGWNIRHAEKTPAALQPVLSRRHFFPEFLKNPYAWGVLSALMVACFGNLKTLHMVIAGFVRYVQNQTLPYVTGDWLWMPTRIIPAPGNVTPITEFPFFTFLYADLHAHMIAFPAALLALSWALSLVLADTRLFGRCPGSGGKQSAAVIAAGGLIIGAFLPMNTWDYPTYLLLGSFALGWNITGIFSSAGSNRHGFVTCSRLFFTTACSFVALLCLSFMLYCPFTTWYQRGYTAVELWKGPRTPVYSYITHFGVFLFCIISWLAIETEEIVKQNRLKTLLNFSPVVKVVLCSALVLVTVLLFLQQIQISLIAAPLIIWSLVLLCRKQLSAPKRMVLFLTIAALALTLLVEVIVIRGDIGRMNTVFKFYLQAWILFALASAAALFWSAQRLKVRRGFVKKLWLCAVLLVLCSALLYPIIGTLDKTRDRISSAAPETLDGMAYMEYARYQDQGKFLTLKEDYQAIRWMHDNIQGTPVIIEAHTPEYRWGSRYSVYTGLPGVIGWSWHERQQRNTVPADWVLQRIADVRQFYETTSTEEALKILAKYRVEYIIVGQLERLYYPGPGLDKFKAHSGLFWHELFCTGDTAIYRVKNKGS